jgi:rhodanese-related sulfurtransferase
MGWFYFRIPGRFARDGVSCWGRTTSSNGIAKPAGAGESVANWGLQGRPAYWAKTQEKCQIADSLLSSTYAPEVVMKSLARSRGAFLFATALLLVTTVVAIAAETPASLASVTVVDAAKAKALMDGGAVMVDARVANEYAEAHIKGAKSIPYKEKSVKAVDYNPAEDTFDVGKLPSDKNAALVFACNGAECWKSYKAAAAAVNAGYKKVYWFRDGFPGWKAKGYPVE